MAGIWQPVRLIVTNEQRLDDVYFRSAQDGAVVETTVSGTNASELVVRHTLFEQDPQQTPHALPLRLKDQHGSDRWQSKVSAEPGNVNKVQVKDVRPRLWSPEHPNLYWLRTLPGVPVVMHSGYVRPTEDFEAAIEPHGHDDGDIDDGHHYFGWYTQSPFRVDVQKDIESRSKYPERPLISQEASTGYPDNDTGHAAESYIRAQRTPQIWVGRHALLTARPDAFLETHALITKEMAEKIRRDRNIIDGWGLFASTCWFRDVYDARRITPYPVYWAVQRAYEPVLVSLVTANRHYDAGEKFTSDVVICNDDPDRPRRLAEPGEAGCGGRRARCRCWRSSGVPGVPSAWHRTASGGGHQAGAVPNGAAGAGCHMRRPPSPPSV